LFFIWVWNLVVLSVRFSLCIKDSSPVLRLECCLVVNINLNLNNISLGLTCVNGDSSRLEKSSYDLSDRARAPVSLSNLSGLKVESGSENGIADGISLYLSERKRLVDRRTLVSKSPKLSTLINSNADSKSSSNSRGSLSGSGKVISGDTWYILKLRLDLSCHVQGSSWAGNLRGKDRLEVLN
jgi:hypothetical protein